jgi:hypothetical protein
MVLIAISNERHIMLRGWKDPKMRIAHDRLRKDLRSHGNILSMFSLSSLPTNLLVVFKAMYFFSLANKLTMLRRGLFHLNSNTFSIIFHDELCRWVANFESLGCLVDSEAILHDQLNKFFLFLCRRGGYLCGDEAVVLLGLFGVVVVLVVLPLWHIFAIII